MIIRFNTKSANEALKNFHNKIDNTINKLNVELTLIN